MSTATRYTFDREFGAGQTPASDVHRYRRHFTRDEVQAAQDEGFAAGEQSEMVRVERDRNAALQQIAAALQAFIPSLHSEAARLKNEAASLAFAASQAVAREALSRFPEEHVREVFADMAETLRGEPQVTLTVPATHREALEPRLRQMADAHGLAAMLEINGDDQHAPGAITITWRQGVMHEDPALATGRVRAAIASWLAEEDAGELQLDLFDNLMSEETPHE